MCVHVPVVDAAGDEREAGDEDRRVFGDGGPETERDLEDDGDAPADPDDPAEPDEPESTGVEARFFDPPLYLQRYQAVLDVLAREEWVEHMNKVVDFGCAECKFLRRLKQLPFVHELLGVDLDRDLMDECAEWTAPLPYDFLEPRKHTRLDLHIMHGSIAEKDSRLAGTDAVTAIELLEHLPNEVLSAVPDNVFGHVKPKLAVFTTPNRDFNPLFPNFVGPFRHWDHRFEWTREEFREWAESVVARFPEYRLAELTGVGEGKEGEWSLDRHGLCSQMALFVRKDFDALLEEERASRGDQRSLKPHLSEEEYKRLLSLAENLGENETPYTLVRTHTFPLTRDKRSPEERLFDELRYYLHNEAAHSDDWAEGREARVDLNFVMDFSRVKDLAEDVDHARGVLEANGYRVEAGPEGEGWKVVMPLEEEDDTDDELDVWRRDENDELEGHFREHFEIDEDEWD